MKTMTRQEIEKYILKTYGIAAEYPWITAPKYAVYHMVKGKWITIMLDGVDAERIKWLIGMSFELTMKKR